MTRMLETTANILEAQLAMNGNGQLKALGGAFALNGNGHLKVGEVKEIGGRRIPTRITVIPEREEGKRTEMHYLQVRFDVELDDSRFSLQQLERRH